MKHTFAVQCFLSLSDQSPFHSMEPQGLRNLMSGAAKAAAQRQRQGGGQNAKERHSSGAAQLSQLLQ